MEILGFFVEGLGVDTRHFKSAQKRVSGNASWWSVSPVNTNRSSSWAGSICQLNPFSQLTSAGCEVLKGGRRIPIIPRNESFCLNLVDIMQVPTSEQYNSIQN